MEPQPAAKTFLSAEASDGIAAVLQALGWLAAGEAPTAVTRAGDGNMNLVLRVTAADGRTAVLKQSRPWVEKYPEVAAPEDRILGEIDFYETVANSPTLAGRMPRLLAADPARRVALFEDLGAGTDGLAWYQAPEQARAEDLAALGRWLRDLHELPPPRSLGNRAMRTLNHAHIFELPYGDRPLLDLNAVAPGLAALRVTFTTADVRRRIAAAGARYLSDAFHGDRLLHGDYYPGSWLRTTAADGADRLWVIDPEFAFVGPREFDVGVALAHLQLAGIAGDDVDGFTEAYGVADAGLDQALLRSFTGVEIARRLLGLAQLPLPERADRRALLAQALALLDTD